MAQKITSLQVKVLELFFTSLHAKVTENYLSKVTRYFYFVTEQHWTIETSDYRAATVGPYRISK